MYIYIYVCIHVCFPSPNFALAHQGSSPQHSVVCIGVVDVPKLQSTSAGPTVRATVEWWSDHSPKIGHVTLTLFHLLLCRSILVNHPPAGCLLEIGSRHLHQEVPELQAPGI